MYQKFIITDDGVLKFGNVYLHRELLEVGEECVYGGGLWKVDESRNAILLYGRSFDFGPPDFDYVRRIEWSGVGGRPAPLFFLPDWPNEDMLILAPFSACTSILESKSKCNFLNIKMCGTKTCEKCSFLMRKGTKMALKPSGTL